MQPADGQALFLLLTLRYKMFPHLRVFYNTCGFLLGTVTHISIPRIVRFALDSVYHVRLII
jgi:hypothetical protein